MTFFGQHVIQSNSMRYLVALSISHGLTYTESSHLLPSDRHARSLITIAMLVALNREGELRLHLAAAVNNGVTRDEIKELLLHASLYCGLPAANASIKLAEEVFAEQDSEGAQSGSKASQD